MWFCHSPSEYGCRVGKSLTSRVGVGEPGHLDRLSLCEEPVDDPALVEDLQRAGVETSRTRAHQLRRRTPLEDHDIDPRQLQLGTQHQARRATSDDDDVDHLISLLPAGSSSVTHDRGLAASPPVSYTLEVARAGPSPLSCPRVVAVVVVMLAIGWRSTREVSRQQFEPLEAGSTTDTLTE